MLHLNYTNTTPPMKWCSVIIKPRTDRKNKNGAYPLIVQLFIKGKKVVFTLDLTTLPEAWDHDRQQFNRKDPDAIQKNAILADIRGHINQILLNLYQSGKTVTAEAFTSAYKHKESTECFIQFYNSQLHQRYNSGELTHGSYKAQAVTLNRLRRMAASIPFSEISPAWLEKFKRFTLQELRAEARKKGITNASHSNTIWSQVKNLRTYINLANRMGIKCDYPFKVVKTKSVSARIIFLETAELKALVNMYRSNHFSGFTHYSLQVFLFGVYSSLRISDILTLTSDHIESDHIVLQPTKTIKFNKTVRIPLNKVTREILNEKTGRIFPDCTAQAINRQLKIIAAAAGIKKHLSMHVARHTFATEFLRRGGQAHVLKQIMGHSDIKITMIYTHIDPFHYRSQMDIMND